MASPVSRFWEPMGYASLAGAYRRANLTHARGRTFKGARIVAVEEAARAQMPKRKRARPSVRSKGAGASDLAKIERAEKLALDRKAQRIQMTRAGLRGIGDR